MMETIKISVTQPRVANPLEATTSRYGIIVIADNKEVLIVREGKISEYMDFAALGYYRLAAMVNVTRPAIMAGDEDEVESDIIGIIRKSLVRTGVCSENECGVLFAN